MTRTEQLAGECAYLRSQVRRAIAEFERVVGPFGEEEVEAKELMERLKAAVDDQRMISRS